MKIVDKSKDTVKFADLRTGDVFLYNDSSGYDRYYMKAEQPAFPNTALIKEIADVLVNTICLNDGHLFTFFGSDEVKKVNATLIIGGEEE